MPANKRLPVPVPQLGVDKSRPPWNIDPSYALRLQDVLLDQVGYARRRGPFSLVSGPPALTYGSPGIMQVMNPQGGHRVATVQGDAGSNKLLSFLAAAYTSVASSYTLPHAVGKSTIMSAMPAMKRGAWLGLSSRYDAQATFQSLSLWRGAINTDTSGGTTITATRGSKSVTGAGSFSSAVTPGAHLFATSNTVTGSPTTFIGVVQSVSGSTVTLEEPALAGTAAGATPDFRAVRGFCPRVTTGTITCSTGSATVNGGDTRFKSQGLGSGVWQLFRARDLTYIGEVSSVTSNIQLTLGASAAIAMDNEFYIAIQMNGDFSINVTSSNWTTKVGFLTAAYAGRQFYANSYRVGDAGNYQWRLWYSSLIDPEAVDLSEDGGSWIPVNSTSGYNYPILALYPTYAGLVIAKQNEVLLLTGDSPSNFSVRQLLGTDGALGPGTFVQHEGGCLWAGKRGVYMFDGTSVVDVSEKLGNGYQESLTSFDPETYRAYGLKHRNHYLLSLESIASEAIYTTVAASSSPDTFASSNYSIRKYLIGGEATALPAGSSRSTQGASAVDTTKPAIGKVFAGSEESLGRNGGYVTGGSPTAPAYDSDIPSSFSTSAITITDAPSSGHVSLSASAVNTLASGEMRVVAQRIPYDATISEFYVYLDGAGAGSGSQVFKGVVYSDTGAGAPNALLAQTAEITVTDGQAAGWVTCTLTSSVSITAGNIYWFGLLTGTNTNTIRWLASNGESQASHLQSGLTYSSGPPSTAAGAASTTGRHGVYFTYDYTFTPKSIVTNNSASAYPTPNNGNYWGAMADQDATSALSPDMYGQIVMETWIKVSTMPTGGTGDDYHGVMGAGNGSGAQDEYAGVMLSSTGVLVGYRIPGGIGQFTNASYSCSTAAGTITTNTWYHIVFASTDTEIKLYVNGALAASNLAPTSIASTNYNSGAIGQVARDVAISGTYALFRGKYHRWGVYGGTISAAQVLQRYANGAISGGGSATSSSSLTSVTYCLNLYTGAWSQFTNFMHRGGINLPAETQKKTWAILTNTSSVAKFVEVESMFTATGTDDAETSEGFTQKGPRLYMEYRRFNPGDPSQLVYWKDIVGKIKSTGGALSVVAVPDFGTDGATLGDTIAADTDFDPPKVVRIQKRNTHMGLRIYEPYGTTTITDAYIGPADLTYKLMRLGRSVHA